MGILLCGWGGGVMTPLGMDGFRLVVKLMVRFYFRSRL